MRRKYAILLGIAAVLVTVVGSILVYREAQIRQAQGRLHPVPSSLTACSLLSAQEVSQELGALAGGPVSTVDISTSGECVYEISRPWGQQTETDIILFLHLDVYKSISDAQQAFPADPGEVHGIRIQGIGDSAILRADFGFIGVDLLRRNATVSVFGPLGYAHVPSRNRISDVAHIEALARVTERRL